VFLSFISDWAPAEGIEVWTKAAEDMYGGFAGFVGRRGRGGRDMRR
jgi:hypothetical protein